ncbi:coiled-coil domain-containing protein 92-like, partial [Scleropages formosus]
MIPSCSLMDRVWVTMETSSLARQVESVERSVAFLRREQLALLHGLHLEILSLQKRCAELTCELNVKPPGRTQAEVEEEEKLLETRCQEVEAQLREQQRTLDELRTELSHKGALVGALRASLKDKERCFLEELKRRSHRSTVLNTELQKQTEVAAYLSFQLHTTRQKLHQQQQLQKQQQLQQQQQQLPHQQKTHPRAAERLPSAALLPAASARPKRRGHKLAAQLRAERARECVPRERVTGPEEPTAMPDPALFLYPRRHRPHLRLTTAHRQQQPQATEEARDQPETLEELEE